jgi:hypothetical protein
MKVRATSLAFAAVVTVLVMAISLTHVSDGKAIPARGATPRGTLPSESWTNRQARRLRQRNRRRKKSPPDRLHGLSGAL